MKLRLVANILGVVLQIEGLLMLPSLLVAVIYQEQAWASFVICIVLLLGLGTILRLLRKEKAPLHVRDGFSAVALIWVAVAMFGALPFVFSGAIPSYVDAFFEIMSGFTTTGSTILTDVEALPNSLHFWRAFSHWLGGMGILLMAVALIAGLGSGGAHLIRAESPGPIAGKLTPKLRESAKWMYLIYLALSVMLWLILVLLGMPVFDAFIHTFATAGTGGFSNKATSVGSYHNPAFDWVLGIFMILFGVNFGVYYLLLCRRWEKAKHSEEVKTYLLIVLAATVLIVLNIRPLFGSLGEAVTHGFFQVTSIISTTGFATTDFNLWPTFSKCILLGLMFIGACAGSTAGGLKVSRLLILGKSARRELSRIVHPRMVHSIRLDNKQVESDVARGVAVYFTMLVGLAAIGVLLLSLEGHDFLTTFSAVLTCVSNTGPGFGLVGPMESFALFSAPSKVMLSFFMLLGRLEILPIMLFVGGLFQRKG